MTSRFCLAFSGLIFLSPQALAQTPSASTGIYMGIVGGPQFFNGGDVAFDYNTGYVIGGQLGYKFGSWRAEAEISYESSEFRDVDNDVFDFEVIRGGVSLFYDLATAPAHDALSPYIGGGIGASNINAEGTDDSTFEDDETGLTLHSEIGMTIKMTQSIAIAPHYRFEWFETGIAGFDDYFHAHAFRVAARLGF